MEKIEFVGKFLKLTTEERSDGTVAERVYVRGGVSIIAIREDLQICLIKEEDFHTGQVRTKLPSGYLEPEEDALQCAMRELKAETGLTADHWEIFVHSQTEGSVRKDQYYFIAMGLHEGVANLDPGEKIVSVEYRSKEDLYVEVLRCDFGTTSTAFVLLKLLSE